jgi:spore maturation protein CgeB
MRIFAAVRHSADPRRYYGGLWSGNFYPALRQLGHEVIESDVDLLPLSRFMHVPGDFTREELQARAEVTEKILREVQAAHHQRSVDLFLSYFYNAHFDPAGFDELRKLGIPSVNFYCNSVYQFKNVAEVARRAEFSWHPEKNARNLYLNVGANPVWVQMGADPGVYHPIPEISRQPSACFVGQRYADRDRWLAALIQNKIPVTIYGPGWPRDAENKIQRRNNRSEYLGRIEPQPGSSASYLLALRHVISNHGLITGMARALEQIRYRKETRRLSPMFSSYARGAIPFENIAEVFAGHEVCLNFSNVWSDGRPGSALIPHVRLRDFEAPMCRTCYLTGHTDEIAEFYDIGKEIDTYRTPGELVDKTKFYLNDREAAERLRAAGYARARRDHTWVRRFEELFTKTGLQADVAAGSVAK